MRGTGRQSDTQLWNAAAATQLFYYVQGVFYLQSSRRRAVDLLREAPAEPVGVVHQWLWPFAYQRKEEPAVPVGIIQLWLLLLAGTFTPRHRPVCVDEQVAVRSAFAVVVFQVAEKVGAGVERPVAAVARPVQRRVELQGLVVPRDVPPPSGGERAPRPA